LPSIRDSSTGFDDAMMVTLAWAELAYASCTQSVRCYTFGSGVLSTIAVLSSSAFDRTLG
jgi:hypothetical protein